MFGINLAYNTRFMWLTNLLNKIPTVNATQPSTLSIQAEAARLQPHKQKSGTNRGSSYVDDFESTQTGIDLRSPYAWTLASTPYQRGARRAIPRGGIELTMSTTAKTARSWRGTTSTGCSHSAIRRSARAT